MNSTVNHLYSKGVQCLKAKLYEPYQPEGCKWMIQRELVTDTIEGDEMPKGGILADEVGLGKTITTISVILSNRLPKTLIILPKSLVSQWISQIKRFCGSSINVHLIDKEFSITDDKTGIFVMSQSLLNCRGSVVGKSKIHMVKWDRVIIDEAHSLRNKKSKYYQSCCLLDSNIRWALSATPVMNRMLDFINIMNWVGVDAYYCQAEKDQVCSMFILRRTKEDVKKHNKSLSLPKCHTEIKYIPFDTDEELNIYSKTFHKERGHVKETNNYIYMLENLLRIRQICIHPQLYYDGIAKKSSKTPDTWIGGTTKINHLLESFKNHNDTDKTLVFCQFVKEMTLIAEALKTNGYQSVRLDGTMSIEERNEAVESFKKNSDVKVFLIQINTGGQGINLQVANRIYIMSPNWNPAVEHQAIGRCHRTGQRKEVFVTKFVISSGDSRIPFVEENIVKLQENKREIVADILNENVNNDDLKTCCELSKKDIYTLFNIWAQ